MTRTTDRPMRPDGTWLFPLGALLVLAIVVGWPFGGTGWQVPAAHGHQTAIFDHHASAVLPPLDAHDGATHDAHCGASAMGCCMMTLCHPAIPAESCATPALRFDAAAEPAILARGTGSNPRIVVPPPRILPV